MRWRAKPRLRWRDIPLHTFRKSEDFRLPISGRPATKRSQIEKAGTVVFRLNLTVRAHKGSLTFPTKMLHTSSTRPARRKNMLITFYAREKKSMSHRERLHPTLQAPHSSPTATVHRVPTTAGDSFSYELKHYLPLISFPVVYASVHQYVHEFVEPARRQKTE